MSDSTPTPPMPVAPKSGRGLRIALAISVALNLAVAGMVAGASLRHRADGGRDDMVRELGFGPFTEALSRQDRHALRQSFLAKSPDARAIKRQRRDDAMAVLNSLRAQPFVPENLSALMAAQQQRTAQQLALGQEVLRDFLVAMSPDDRAAFAGRLQQRLHPNKGAEGQPTKNDDPLP